MIQEIDIFGVFVTPALVWMAVALALAWAQRFAMERLRLYRFVWHKPLFDLAVLVLLFCGVARWAVGA